MKYLIVYAWNRLAWGRSAWLSRRAARRAANGWQA